LLGNLLNSPVASGTPQGANADECFDRSGPFVIRQQHLIPPVEGKVVTIIRDPRDVLVSNMHYWGESLEDALERKFRGKTWHEFVQLWLDEGVPFVTYEGLLKQPSVALEGVLDLLSVNYDPDRLQDAIHRQSFDERKKLVRDKKDEAGRFTYGPVHEEEKVLRKGIVGDWRNHFNRNIALIAHRAFSPLMYELGYEHDLNWWQRFTPTVPDPAH
jgi:hypothetical protein